jgi:hypothetical protein
MQSEYWHKQAAEKPLFPDLMWSRPENRTQAGKLLIIGGNVQGFAAAAEAYAAAEKAGIGTARVLLPDSLQKTVGRIFEVGEYAPSTPNGSFSQKALAELLADAHWADGVLIAGDLGRNSETAILLEKFVEKYPGQLIITKDAVDYFTNAPQPLLNRPDTTLVLSLAQLQKLATNAKFLKPFTFGMDMVRLVGTLHDFTSAYSINLVVKHLENIFVATSGEVSSTKLPEDVPTWCVTVGAYASVWSVQNLQHPFPALTSAVYQVTQS